MSKYVVLIEVDKADRGSKFPVRWKELGTSYSDSAAALRDLRGKAEPGFRYRIVRVVQELEFTKTTKVVTTAKRVDSAAPRKRAPKAEAQAAP